MIWPFWKRGRQSLKKLNILLTTQPRNSAHRHPGIHSREMKMCVHTKTFRQMSTGVLFYRKKKKNWRQSKIEKWVDKESAAQLCWALLFSKKKKQTTNTCNTDEAQTSYSVQEGFVLPDFIYATFPEEAKLRDRKQIGDCLGVRLKAGALIVRAMVFPGIMYRCENWTIKKAEHWRIDAFELWCWRRLLRVPWTTRRSYQSILKKNQPWIFIGSSDAEAETTILWPPDVKSQLIGKDPDAGKDCGQEEKGTTEDEMVGWHHWLNGLEFKQTPGDSEGSLVCFSPQGCKESDTTKWLNSKKWLNLQKGPRDL